MEKENNYKINDIILLSDNKEYAIIKQLDNYYLFMSLEQPITILVGKIENDCIKIVNDKEIIKEVLSS